MDARQLILLSPYRLPTDSAQYFADEEVAAFLNGYSALWHPAALAGGAELPRLASPYDHEQPAAGAVYAVPDNPTLMLPDDWPERVIDAGAVTFEATADRGQTLQNLFAALATLPGDEGRAAKLAAAGAEQVAPFLGLGLGHLALEALFEAMSHDNVLAGDELRAEVHAAVATLEAGDADGCAQSLQAAAERLQSAREVLYPVTIHLVDMGLLDESAPEKGWPGAFDHGQPCTLIACAALLERLGKEHPERLAALRERVEADTAEVCGGPYVEREDPLLPLESQLWNLLKGQEVYERLLGREVRVFGRKRFGFHPNLPLLLHNVGIPHALLLVFDDAVIPSHRSTVVSWPSPDGKQVDSFARAPHPADSPQTYFHLAHHLHQTIMQDQAATLALLHRGKPAAPWYDDWLALTKLAPVLGKWTTLSGYFNDALAGDYASAASPDDFHGDYLLERTGYVPEDTPPEQAPAHKPVPAPLSGFAAQARGRRRIDAAWTFAGVLRGLGGQVGDVDGVAFEEYLRSAEDAFEAGASTPEELLRAQTLAAEALARRLLARAGDGPGGHLILNPCSFIRRVALELPDVPASLPLSGPLKACQVEGGVAKVVVEVPALGFAWVPRSAPGAAAPPAARMRLADERMVRNEFFEAEVDAQTGGLRAIRDLRTRVNRVGQQLVFQPGSTMRVREVRTTSTGPALGEIVTEGVLVDAAEQVLATFRQRFRAWIGRPLLELRIEIEPAEAPEGYPWHAYYGARFAWRDEGAALLRGAFGAASPTSQTRPETPDFLEVRAGRQNTVIFPGGLPFHLRQGGRMLDVLLIAPGEPARAFELGIGLDREQPMQTALGLVSPVAVVATPQGPPHVGAAGWLFHLDAANLMLSSLRPAPGGVQGVTARLLEIAGYGGPAELRCARDPVRALTVDARGATQTDISTQGDAVQLDASPNDLIHLRVDFA